MTHTLAAAGVLFLGCHHGGSPTSPGEPFIKAAITTSLNNAAHATSLLEAELLFDGKVVSDQTLANPASVIAFNAEGVLDPARLAMTCDTSDPLNPPPDLGPHTLDIIILRQTFSPSPFTVSSPHVHVDEGGGGYVDLSLGSYSGSLATGQAVHYDFCL